MTRPLTREEFADRVDGLDRDDLRAFVAAVLDAADGDRPRRVHVLGRRRRLPDAAADARAADDGSDATAAERVAVVRSAADDDLRERARDAGVRLVDVDDLRELALYGLDPAVGDDLCRTHLGTPARVEGTGPTADVGPRSAFASGLAGRPGSTPGTAPDADPSSAVDASADAGTGSGSAVDPPALARLRSVGGGFVVGLVVALLVASAATGAVPGLRAGIGTGSSGAGPATPTAGPATTTATATPASTPTARPPTTPDDGGSVAERYAQLAPRCDRPPGLVVAAQVAALGSVGGNATGTVPTPAAGNATNGTTATTATPAGVPAGIRAGYRFSSPTNRRFVGGVADFERILVGETFAPLLSYTTVEYGPVERGGDVANREVTVADANGTTATYRFTLVRQSGGQYDGCWMTEGVVRTSPASEA